MNGMGAPVRALGEIWRPESEECRRCDEAREQCIDGGKGDAALEDTLLLRSKHHQQNHGVVHDQECDREAHMRFLFDSRRKRSKSPHHKAC